MRKISEEFKALGTVVYLEIVTAESEASRAEESLDKARNLIGSKEKLLSRFDPQSELSFLNSRLDEWHDASADLIHLAKQSLNYYEESEHLFDPRIIENLEAAGYEEDLKDNDFSNIRPADPILGGLKEDLEVVGSRVRFRKRMDFSGIAKGYICDKVSDFLKAEGWADFLVDAGGDMYLCGNNEIGEPWKIDIEGVDPRDLLLSLSGQAIATSGITRRFWNADGRRFHHLVDPKNPGDFRTGLLTVSVIADTTEQADFWAKTIFLMKDEAKAYVDQKRLKAVIRYENDYWLSRAISEQIR